MEYCLQKSKKKHPWHARLFKSTCFVSLLKPHPSEPQDQHARLYPQTGPRSCTQCADKEIGSAFSPRRKKKKKSKRTETPANKKLVKALFVHYSKLLGNEERGRESSNPERTSPRPHAVPSTVKKWLPFQADPGAT